MIFLILNISFYFHLVQLSIPRLAMHTAYFTNFNTSYIDNKTLTSNIQNNTIHTHSFPTYLFTIKRVSLKYKKKNNQTFPTDNTALSKTVSYSPLKTIDSSKIKFYFELFSKKGSFSNISIESTSLKSMSGIFLF